MEAFAVLDGRPTPGNGKKEKRSCSLTAGILIIHTYTHTCTAVCLKKGISIIVHGLNVIYKMGEAKCGISTS